MTSTRRSTASRRPTTPGSGSALEVGEAGFGRWVKAAAVNPATRRAVRGLGDRIATPSIDARLINRLALRSDSSARRSSGWAASPAPLARPALPTTCAPSRSIRPRSQRRALLADAAAQDLSIPNIIASGLFGDGAAAVVLGGGGAARAEGPRVVASRSVFYPDTERVMGWDVVDTGFKIVLDAAGAGRWWRSTSGATSTPSWPTTAWTPAHRHWVCHSGGPKVLEAFEAASSSRGRASAYLGLARRARQPLQRLGAVRDGATARRGAGPSPGVRDAAGDGAGLLLRVGPAAMVSVKLYLGFLGAAGAGAPGGARAECPADARPGLRPGGVE